MDRKQGFTLIELMVVIAIIAILSTVGLATYSHVQKSARDSRRKQDIRSIQAALELYYEANNRYPKAANFFVDPLDGPAPYSISTSSAPWISELTTTYIPILPVDPLNTLSTAQFYVYMTGGTLGDEHTCNNNAQHYLLYAQLENSADPQNNISFRNSFVPCNGTSSGWGTNPVYAVTDSS